MSTLTKDVGNQVALKMTLQLDLERQRKVMFGEETITAAEA